MVEAFGYRRDRIGTLLTFSGAVLPFADPCMALVLFPISACKVVVGRNDCPKLRTEASSKKTAVRIGVVGCG
jgi:hypothetical protein